MFYISLIPYSHDAPPLFLFPYFLLSFSLYTIISPFLPSGDKAYHEKYGITYHTAPSVTPPGTFSSTYISHSTTVNNATYSTLYPWNKAISYSTLLWSFLARCWILLLPTSILFHCFVLHPVLFSVCSHIACLLA
jgi:hypothetical protein